MEAQKRYAQVSQSVVLAVLLATLFIGGAVGYGLRSADTAQAGSDRTQLVPRSAREGIEITPFQAPAPRWTHEDDVIGSSTK